MIIAIATFLGDGTYYDQNNIVRDGFGNKTGTLDDAGTVSRINRRHASANIRVPNTDDNGMKENVIPLAASLIAAALLLSRTKD